MGWLKMFGLMVVALIAAVIVIVILAELPWFHLITGWMIIGLLAVWALAFYDIWRRADMSGVSIAIWSVAIILLPFLGTIAYAIARPSADKITYRGDAPID